MKINDFKTLLLNRNEIEQALGINLTQTLTADEQCLNDYAMFSTIPLEDATAIFLGLNPNNQKHNRKYPRYLTVFNVVETAVRRGEIKAEITQDFDINGNEIQFDISLTHDTAKAWAQTHGLKWNIPPYRKPSEDAEGNNQAIELENLSKPVIDSTELQEEKAQNAQLKAEIERLKAENAELKAQLQDNAQRKSAVDSNDFSIYGHKSELLDILFKVIAEFWADSETPPKNSVIEQWIETNYPVKNYPYVSKAVRQYIATILRPQPKLK